MGRWEDWDEEGVAAAATSRGRRSVRLVGRAFPQITMGWLLRRRCAKHRN